MEVNIKRNMKLFWYVNFLLICGIIFLAPFWQKKESRLIRTTKYDKTAYKDKRKFFMQGNLNKFPINISVCTQVRNDCHLMYSWVLFHYFQGVNKFHIYLIDPEDCTEDVLKDFVDQGIVEIHYWTNDAFKYKHKFFLGKDNEITTNPSMFYNKKIEECSDSIYKSKTTLDNSGWEACQRTSIFDCIVRHEHFDGLLGVIDVDEYIFSPNMTLSEAFSKLERKDVYQIEGLIYGMSYQYKKQLPIDILPYLHKRHISASRPNSLAYRKENGIKYRNWAMKSFYKLPNYFSGNTKATVHKNREYDNDKVLIIDKKNSTVMYNHYMYRSLEESALSSINSRNYERKLYSKQWNIFEEEYGSRMDPLIQKFKSYFDRIEVKNILKLLKPREPSTFKH